MPELVVFVGLPAAGKTTFYRNQFAATHVHVSKDLMKNVRNRGSRQRDLIVAALREGKSVVVDNTNPTPEIRAELIQLAREHGMRVIAYYFDTPIPTVLARNRGREGKARVPDAAIFVTRAKLKPPTAAEGFDEVHVVTPPPP